MKSRGRVDVRVQYRHARAALERAACDIHLHV
jgi:hypothetical protein